MHRYTQLTLLIKLYCVILKVLAALLPFRTLKRTLRRHRKTVLFKSTESELHADYDAVIQRLKQEQKKRPLHVLFLVHDCAKWSAQSLYDALEKDTMFTVEVLIVPDARKISPEKLEKDYNFFRQRNMNVSYGVDFNRKKVISPKSFSPDFVFFPERGFSEKLGKEYSSLSISKYALTCYVPYAFMDSAEQ